MRVRPDNLLDLFELDPARPAPLDGAPEPRLEAGPNVVEFDYARRIDPRRATAEPESPPSASRQRRAPFGLIGSLAIHLLPLLALVEWRVAPAEIAAPIPVQLVIEKPPPPPSSSTPPPEKRRPPGRLASDDMGETAVRQRQEGAASKVTPVHPAPTQMVSALPPPAAGSVALPEPSDEQPATAPILPQPRRRPAAAPAVHRPEPAPREAHFGRVLGPAATRDEYLAYCNDLIRRHFDMLPLSFVGGRRGRTILRLLVLDDGTIAHIAVAQSSGYPDIDARIEQIVAAVRRFPPVPQWFQGSSMPLEYELPFPDALARR